MAYKIIKQGTESIQGVLLEGHVYHYTDCAENDPDRIDEEDIMDKQPRVGTMGERWIYVPNPEPVTA